MRSKILRIIALVIPPFAIFTGDFFAATNLSVGEISDRYFGDVLIIPAGWAFSIWILIYVGILVLAVAQAWPGRADNLYFRRARLPLILTMIFNWLWIVTWQSLLIPAATLVLFGQFATAIWLYYALGIPADKLGSGLNRWICAGVSIYVGWLTVASILGVAIILNFYGWQGEGLGAATWAVIVLLVGTVLAIFLRNTWNDAFYGAVFVWAYIAVAAKPEQATAVIVAAIILAVLIAATLIPNVRVRPYTRSQIGSAHRA